jgi:hypothetical protein
MYKLILIGLLISLPATASDKNVCDPIVKTCNAYIKALTQENKDLKQALDDTRKDRDAIAKEVADEKKSVPSAVWVSGGLVSGAALIVVPPVGIGLGALTVILSLF